jgi:hypothetical protein
MPPSSAMVNLRPLLGVELYLLENVEIFASE